MRNPSFAHLVGGARCALFGSLLWLAASVGAQEAPLPFPGNAVETAPEEVPFQPGATAQGAHLQQDAIAQATPAPQPPAKPKGATDLLDLPLESLAEQPVRITAPEAAAHGVAAAGAAPGAAAAPAGFGPIVAAASRREERVTAAPAGVVVIDRREIVLRGYSTLTDVLRDLPGMETIDFFFSEFGTQVPVRGISGNNKIVVLVNGMRVNPPGGENFPFRNDFSVRFAERIEVVYGSGGVLYGQDAISAIINIVTMKPTGDASAGETLEAFGVDDPAARPGAWNSGGASKLSVQMGADGGVNLERDAWAWFGGYLDKEHNLTATGYIQYHNSDLTPFDREFPSYWQDYKNVALTKTNANGQGVTPSREDFGLNIFGRVEGYGSSIQVWHRNSARSSAEGFNPGLGFLPEGRWEDRSTVVEAKNTLHLASKVTLESTATYNRYEIDPNSRYVFPASPTTWFLEDFKYGIGWQGRQEETLRIEMTPRFSLLAGEVISYSDIIPKASFTGGFDPNRSPVDQGGFFTYTDASGTHSIPQVSEVKYWDYSPYVEAQWQVLDRLRLIGGTRVTWDERFKAIPITPRAAVVYNLTDQITAKYVYTQGFVAPAPYFAFSTFDNGTLLATTNPNVAPETAQTHEVILAYNRKNLSLTFNPYYGTQSDIITVADRNAPQNFIEFPVFVPVDPSPRTLVQTANGGVSTRIGADLYGKATFGCVSPWFSYSYVDFKEDTAGTITGLPGISRNNGRLGATWTVSQKLFVTPSLVIRSTPENVKPGKLAEELETPYEINMFVLYKPSPSMDIFFNLRNITDHHYALGGFAGDAIPQETFHGVVGLQVRW